MNIEIFAILFDKNGKILLRKKGNELTKGDWSLPGGIITRENFKELLSEKIIQKELSQKIQNQLGLSITISRMPALYPAISRYGKWSFCTIIGEITQKPQKGVWGFFSFQEVNQLTKRSEGNHLKKDKIYRFVLKGLSESPNSDYQKMAIKQLNAIQENM